MRNRRTIYPSEQFCDFLIQSAHVLVIYCWVTNHPKQRLITTDVSFCLWKWGCLGSARWPHHGFAWCCELDSRWGWGLLQGLAPLTLPARPGDLGFLSFSLLRSSPTVSPYSNFKVIIFLRWWPKFLQLTSHKNPEKAHALLWPGIEVTQPCFCPIPFHKGELWKQLIVQQRAFYFSWMEGLNPTC